MTTWASQHNDGSELESFEGIMDGWLLGVLSKDKNRAMLARLENTLTSFMHDTLKKRLEFPPKSAFQRKVFHRVAVYYGLDHKILEGGSGGQSEMRSLVLIKTDRSRVPKTRLSDLNLDLFKENSGSTPQNNEVPSSMTSADRTKSATQLTESEMEARTKAGQRKQAVFLRRPCSDSNLYKSEGGRSENGAGSRLKIISDAEYEQARARIFQRSLVDSADDALSKHFQMNEFGGFGIRMAKGPTEGTIGFDARARDTNTPTSSEPSSIPGVFATSNGMESAAHIVTDGNSQGRKKVARKKLRKSEEKNDIYDPDFDRSYSRWAAPHVPLQDAQAGTNMQESAYFNGQGYAEMNSQMHHSSNAQYSQAEGEQYHNRYHVLPGMPAHTGLDGSGYGYRSAEYGRTAPSNAKQDKGPLFSLDTMSDFPSLAQAQAMSNKKN